MGTMCSDARGSCAAAPTVSISSVTTGRGDRRHTPGMAARTILVVEDEDSIALPLAAALEREGYVTRVTGSVPEAIALAAELEPDLMLLDVMLSDGSGLDVCREVRRHSSLPIIMLTARGDETDRVVGLELGAEADRPHPCGPPSCPRCPADTRSRPGRDGGRAPDRRCHRRHRDATRPA